MRTNSLYNIAATIVALLMLQACGPQKNRETVETSTADTTSASASNNAGIPLDNIERKTDADTLKFEDKSSNGVPMNNINRDEKKDCLLLAIPHLTYLDPIGPNIAYGRDPSYGLMYFDLTMQYTSKMYGEEQYI